jgi:hypothetical protein
MLGVLGQWVPSDTDDPQSGQGNGAGANPGAALNLMGVGDSQKTRSTVQYKVPLFDTGGQTVEVAAYGMDHILAPLKAIDSTWRRAVIPEAQTRGLEAASGRVDLFIGQDNYRLFPVEHGRVENAALHRSCFGTGWIASGRPPRQGDPATGAEKTTSAGVRTTAEAATGAEEATSAEAATGAEEATSAEAATEAEEATSVEAATGAEEATSAGAATGAEEATSKEEAVNKGEPAHIATMDKPARPPNSLDEQFAVISAVFVQEPEEPGEPGTPESQQS